MTEVIPKISIVPARRTASYSVQIRPDLRGAASKLVGLVNAKSIRLTGKAAGYSGISSIELPKTQEAVDALFALAHSLRVELFMQGVVRLRPEVSE
jgi:hypothetical protein